MYKLKKAAIRQLFLILALISPIILRVIKMNNQDTVKLLRECDAGVKMGLTSFDEVMNYVHSDRLRSCISECKAEHEEFADEMQNLLEKHSDDGKEPNPIAKSMSWLKTNVMLSVNDSDSVIADLMTDGCNMGIKALSKYLNEYSEADKTSKDLANRIITSEKRLAEDVREFL